MTKTGTRRRQRRIRQNVWLVLASAAGGLVVFGALETHNWWSLVSMTTGYVAMGLLAFTLILGPWNVVRGRPNPVSTDLRRDAGIWCALWGFVHVISGLGVHMGGKWWLYFIPEPGRWRYVPIRTDLFGFANHTGLVATLLLALLLAISSDRALGWLGARRWKSLQRWNYVILLLVVLHGIAYMWIAKRDLLFIALFGVMVGAVGVFQVLGIRRSRTPTGSPWSHRARGR